MKKPYLVCVPVREVSGAQLFRVHAESEEEAIAAFERGEDSEFVSEEIEVVSLGRPESAEEEGQS